MSRKTVVEEAVIQMKNLEDALKENAKDTSLFIYKGN